MYDNIASDNTEGEEQRKMKRKMPVSQPNWLLPILLAMIITALIISLPILSQTRIHIKTSGDAITDVSVDTQNVPLISLLLQPSYGVGVYTINISIVEINMNYTIKNVPSGEYTIVWQNGFPTAGTYTVVIQLFRDNILKDTFTLHPSF